MDCWFSILFMVVLASIADAASSPQDYWKSKLPGTPMPAAVRDLLLPDVDTGFKRVRIDELATSEIGRASATSFYKKGLGMGKLANAMIAKGRATNFCRKEFGMDRLDHAQSNRASITSLYKQGLGMKRLADAQIGLSMESLTNAGNIGNGDTLGMATSLHMDDVANFFLEKDLEPGMKMRLDFSRCTPEMAFLPRAAVSSIPFSSEKLSHILSHFSVQPYSAEADTMRTTLQDCEEDSLDEVKYCPTSLESMVDFATSALGTRDIEVVSSEFAKVGAAKQEYMVVGSSPVQRQHGSSSIACHQQPYPYAVFYCHVTRATRAHRVPLVGKDGASLDAVAVCHTDTSAWSPSHLAFHVLKVKPGTLPICHFLPQDSLVWAHKVETLPALFDN